MGRTPTRTKITYKRRIAIFKREFYRLYFREMPSRFRLSSSTCGTVCRLLRIAVNNYGETCADASVKEWNTKIYSFNTSVDQVYFATLATYQSGILSCVWFRYQVVEPWLCYDSSFRSKKICVYLFELNDPKPCDHRSVSAKSSPGQIYLFAWF